MKNSVICPCKNKDTNQLFVYATHTVQSLFFLNLKFQALAFSLFLRLYRHVCVSSGWKSGRLFSHFVTHKSSQSIFNFLNIKFFISQCSKSFKDIYSNVHNLLKFVTLIHRSFLPKTNSVQMNETILFQLFHKIFTSKNFSFSYVRTTMFSFSEEIPLIRKSVVNMATEIHTFTNKT